MPTLYAFRCFRWFFNSVFINFTIIIITRIILYTIKHLVINWLVCKMFLDFTIDRQLWSFRIITKREPKKKKKTEIKPRVVIIILWVYCVFVSVRSNLVPTTRAIRQVLNIIIIIIGTFESAAKQIPAANICAEKVDFNEGLWHV